MGATEDFRQVIAKRLKEGATLNSLATDSGADGASLNKWYNNKQKSLNFNTVAKLLDYLEINLKEKNLPVPTMRRMGAYSPMDSVQGESLIEIPVYDIAGAVPEFCLEEAEPLINLPILNSYYQKGLFAVKVEGDSMEPLIKNGAYIGVMPLDGSKLIEGAIYLVNNPGFGLVVKQVYSGEDNELVLRSVNPHVKEKTIPLAGFERVIAGKVVWIWQEV